MAHSKPWTLTKHKPSVCRLDLAHGTEVYYLSDIHWDNAHCDLKAFARDLSAAKAQGSPVFIFGDFFCAMQGKWDKRKSRDALRPEHHSGSYLDKLVSTAADWLAPYADCIALITMGNHEASILQHHETNLLERLHERLTQMNGYTGQTGAFAGFCNVGMKHIGKNVSSLLYWHHGYGGGGEVTRGMIDNSRTRGQVWADIHFSGHIHRRNCDENIIQTLSSDKTEIKEHRQLFLRGGTYKAEDGGREGAMDTWHTQKGRTARPIGGWAVRYGFGRQRCREKQRVWMEFDARMT
jgi:hypothetical protein